MKRIQWLHNDIVLHINILLIVLFPTQQTSDVSFNQPQFCSSASWNSSATTVANVSTAGENPFGIFVDTSNTVYVANQQEHDIRAWISGSNNITTYFRNSLSDSMSVFVTRNGDIFADNGKNNCIEKWSVNGTSTISINSTSQSCYGHFVDLNNTIYCSIKVGHQVIKKSLNSGNNTIVIAAGTGIKGSSSNELEEPYGIFISSSFSLYVADSKNHRIQLFQPGKSNGTTVAGSGSLNFTITLQFPTGVTLDADERLFIVDSGNHRIVVSASDGSRCLVGCSCTPGAEPDELNHPATLAFDSYGNMFITDKDNSRIQKFLFMTNSCNDTTTVLALSTSTTDIADTSSNLIRSTLIPTTAVTTTFSQQVAITTFILTSDEPSSTEKTSDVIPNTDSKIVDVISTKTTTISNTPPSYFFVPTCNNVTVTGISCDKLKSPCYLETPCLNNGICIDSSTSPTGYFCSCPPYVNGTKCQNDHRLCKPDTCWNNGTCQSVSGTEFKCQCEDGWQGPHCETKINYCANVTCQNGGMCRPILMNYKCECLGNDYSGRHCEITGTKIKIYKIVSKSFGYIAIISLVTVVTFIVIMDILKYCFGIDPVQNERERLRRRLYDEIRKSSRKKLIHSKKPTAKLPASTIIETTV